MRILYVIDHLRGGGGEQQFIHIVNNVDAEKFVYLTEDRGTRFESLNRAIPLKGGYGKRVFMKSILELKKVMESYRPDIVHAFLMYSSFLTALSTRISRHKLLFIAQEFSPPGEILKEVKWAVLKKSLLKFSYSLADRVLTVSKASKQSFVDDGYVRGEGKVDFIYDGLDLTKYSMLESRDVLRQRIGLSSQYFYISFVGSLVHRKGVEYLIKAFMDINNRNIRLMIVGDGPNGDIFRDMAKGDHRIDFLGYRKDAVSYIKASDLFILPSLYEGLPNAIIEAMFVGTPVIATNVSGIPELIEHNFNGLLVPPGDAKRLKEAALELIGNNELAARFAKESIKKATYFNVDRMIRDYENFYKRLQEERLLSIQS
jgi:glycosyltransferase involved in cell wall biosynthesis